MCDAAKTVLLKNVGQRLRAGGTSAELPLSQYGAVELMDVREEDSPWPTDSRELAPHAAR